MSIHSGLDLHLHWEERRLIRQIPSGPRITPQSSLLGPNSTLPLRPRPNTCRSFQTRGVSSRSIVERWGQSSGWVAYIDVPGVAAAGAALRRSCPAGTAREAPARQAAGNLVRCVHGSDTDGKGNGRLRTGRSTRRGYGRRMLRCSTHLEVRCGTTTAVHTTLKTLASLNRWKRWQPPKTPGSTHPRCF